MKRCVTTILILLAALIGTAGAADWYVNEGDSIQAAINSAVACDTIIVQDGTYQENVDVDKQLTIRSENGSASCIVNASDPCDHVFEM
jgi:nitrous oxidase accessory protein NosD